MNDTIPYSGILEYTAKLYFHLNLLLLYSISILIEEKSQTSVFQRVSEVHGHAIRSAASDISRSTRDQRSLSYRVPKEWSELPNEIQRCCILKDIVSLSATRVDVRFVGAGVEGV